VVCCVVLPCCSEYLNTLIDFIIDGNLNVWLVRLLSLFTYLKRRLTNTHSHTTREGGTQLVACTPSSPFFHAILSHTLAHSLSQLRE